jgi:hypothetical protein
VRRDPSDAHGRLLLSWALHASGRIDEATEPWEAAAALNPSLSAMRMPDHTRSLERVLPSERGVLLDPERRQDAEEARELLSHAESLAQAGDSAAAVTELNRSVLLDPYLAGAHRLLARVHRKRGTTDKSVEELRMALWCREDPTVRSELVELLRSLGRVEEARAASR